MISIPRLCPRINIQNLSALFQAAFLITFLFASSLARAQSVLQTRFDAGTASFNGSKSEQAHYLLSPVLQYGHLGPALDSLPTLLDSLMQDKISIDRLAFLTWLDSNGVSTIDLGGNLDSTLSQNLRGDTAKYFVIHDTSTPWYGDPITIGSTFPANIDSASWRYNNKPLISLNKKAHVFVARTGQSVTANDFSKPWRSTKLELKVLDDSISKGLFLHIELVQPRRRDSLGSAKNDAIAPEPGFTRAQYQRLALLYIAAHVRRGDWLVPAYHAVLDEGIKNAHDDPQNFDLEAWCEELRNLIGEIRAKETRLSE
jgi:hypothetical protein